MKLRIVAAGKLKEAGLRDLVDEYVKRSRRFVPITVQHVRDAAAVRQALVAASASGPRVLLDERGEQPDTHELAQWLRSWQESGAREPTFFVGDADGFSDADRGAADRVLSLSRLTLPHRLALVVLVEQLYRAATVLAGHPYHHE